MSDDFYRIKRLPPYVIAEVNRLKAKYRAEGMDIIDFGMGNPADVRGLSYLTVSAWVYTSTLDGGAYNMRYVVANEGISNSGWYLRLHTDIDKLRWIVYSGAERTATSNTVLSANRWYHVACVYDIAVGADSQVRLYINGVLDAEGTGSGAAIADSNVQVAVGSSPSYTDRPWAGGIRDVRIYGRALSAGEIWQLWAPQTRYDLFRRNLSATVGLPGSVATTTITLTWTDNSEGEDGFSIERKAGAGAYAVVHTTAAGVETWDDTSLPVGATYTYRVRATSAILNNSEYSNEAAVTV